MPVLGGTPHLVMQGGIEGASSYSPDGTQFAFLRYASSDKIDVRIAKADGSNERVIATRPYLDEYAGVAVVSRRQNGCVHNVGGDEKTPICALGRIVSRWIGP